MAGLVAADALRQAGHEPILVEARSRPGGRIWTVRDGLAPGLYAEMGAMRIPRSHRLTMGLIQRLGLPTRPFTMGNPRTYVQINGLRLTRAEAQARAETWGHLLADGEQGQWIGDLWAALLSRLSQGRAAASNSAWDSPAAQHDGESLEAFLRGQGWSAAAIELLGLVHNLESQMHLSALEVLREELGAYYTDMIIIEGGADRLPSTLAHGLRERILYGAQVVALDQDPDGVTLHCHSGVDAWALRGDYAILTLPFTVLRRVDMLKPFSPGKRRAIRQLHYDAAAKIALQVARRFWEEEGIYGGSTVTDLPIRNIYYPDYGAETGRGVLLASYTWGREAEYWGALPPEERPRRAAEDVARIHPAMRRTYEDGLSQVWHEDPFAGGAFVVLQPRQEALHRDVVSVEGRIHIAGEHASRIHGWIEGAVESGLRAAREIQERVSREIRV
jgi:monoamine oxidase